MQENDGFMRLPDVIGDRKRGIVGVLPMCPASWWAGIKSGRYPKGVKLGARMTAWRRSDIMALVAQLGR